MKACCEVAAMFGQICRDCDKAPRAKAPKAKNLCAKTRPKSDPYETWQAGSWAWQVLKKYQADDNKPYARWFCNVITPMVPDGEMGDVYVSEIKSHARRIS